MKVLVNIRRLLHTMNSLHYIFDLFVSCKEEALLFNDLFRNCRKVACITDHHASHLLTEEVLARSLGTQTLQIVSNDSASPNRLLAKAV